METARYLMFYILCGKNYQTSVKEQFYIYDKKECKNFQMKDYTDNSYWCLMADYPHLTNWNKAQNPNLAVRSRSAYTLKKDNGKHASPDLARILDKLTEEDNPVLQIMIFHDVDNIK